MDFSDPFPNNYNDFYKKFQNLERIGFNFHYFFISEGMLDDDDDDIKKKNKDVSIYKKTRLSCFMTV